MSSFWTLSFQHFIRLMGFQTLSAEKCIQSCKLIRLECVFFVWWPEKPTGVYTQKALLYWLHWTGLDWIGWDWDGSRRLREGIQVGMGKGEEGVGAQPSLRQHKQHADTVTGNTVIIILLFKFLLKTLKLYKKEENRISALMKNTFLVFFPPPTKKILIQENKYSKKAKK